MGSHDTFGHLQHKLWHKLTIWLLTTKNRESTWPLCVQVAWNTSLKRSRQELQLCLKPHPDRRSECEVIAPQSCESSNLGSFEIFFRTFGSPGTKSYLDVGLVERCRVYYMREGGGFPQSGLWWILWVQGCPWLILAPKVLQHCINQLVDWFDVHSNE
jgi:hypothetical protein